MSKKAKNNKNNINELEIPLQDLELPINEDEKEESLETKNKRKIPKKVKKEENISFCSKLFFLWTLIVMNYQIKVN